MLPRCNLIGGFGPLLFGVSMATYRYPKPKPQPERKVDVLAGEGSIAGKLKKRREAIEGGDPTGGRPVVGANSADDVLRRGYFKEEDE